MPRYFFHLFNDLDVRDDEGREMRDIAAALRAAETDAREMAAESVRHGHLDMSHCVEVRDQADQVLFRILPRCGDDLGALKSAAWGTDIAAA